jgi:glycosyltransferase involved in cell wall biosynthesis
VTRIDQVVGASGPYDAVTTQALAYRSVFEQDGASGSIYAAESTHPDGAEVKLLERLPEDGRDLLLVHYTGYLPAVQRLLELPGRKLLVYHNITPARYFWNFEPYVATVCQLGRDQLSRWVEEADVCAAVSRFNAVELERAGALEAEVVPILLDPARLEPDEPFDGLPPGRPLVLAVGRLAPHKRHDLILRAFALYQSRHAPEAALLCVGWALDPAYRRRLDRIAHEEGARNVTFVEDIPQARMNHVYRRADVLLSLSEHEGFCVPLLEAFHFGVPVVARRAAALPEVGGDAALWLEPGDDLSVVAELLELAVTDTALREELGRRGRARVEAFSHERATAALRGVVGQALDYSPGPLA